MWLKNSSGDLAVNLSQALYWVANTDGSVSFYKEPGSSTPVTVAGVGTDAASAAEAMRRITRTVDPADY